MRRSIFIVIAVFVFLIVSNVCNATGKNAMFYQAGDFYKQGKYKEAAETYESIVKDGFVSGPLYYNLANSYFKDGKVGIAILNYRRAERLMPRDSDLDSNCKYVNSFVKNNANVLPRNLFLKILDRYKDNLSLDEISKLLLFFYILSGLIVFLGMYLHLNKRKITTITLILAIIFVFNVAILISKSTSERNKAIVVSDLEAKFEPLDSATTHFSLSEGVEVFILKDEGFWFKIKRADGKMGWAAKNSIKKI
ncbi:MAG: tetratricopeptide repeat protein [Candidatus Zapsychrus exili]|nr:tetratricopeptide repeat protein [Candidatus Zapsychrus exili]